MLSGWPDDDESWRCLVRPWEEGSGRGASRRTRGPVLARLLLPGCGFVEPNPPPPRGDCWLPLSALCLRDPPPPLPPAVAARGGAGEADADADALTLAGTKRCPPFGRGDPGGELPLRRAGVKPGGAPTPPPLAAAVLDRGAGDV